jgi:DNA mismatch repair protein MutL
MKRPRVERLPEHVANQIAAGEVVARPSSVVKELVENALDAGARTIVVTIEGGGVGLVRVVDDGCGMNREDARAALERHATSKLRTADDLRTLVTMGFRGEALPSIASVSRFTLRTRISDDDEGTELVTDANGAATVRPCGTSVGTTIEVRDLFFNVPARRKFLRALATESAHVSDALRDTALANPEVQFELWRDGRLHRRWLRVGSLSVRARELFGEDLTLIVDERRGPLHIEAHLSSPSRARSGATGLTLLVNRRPIQDRALARAVAAAYGERIERGQYPLGVVSLTLPTEACDVNVHPQKAEVRFAEPRAVCDALFGAVQRAVETREPASVERASPARSPQRPAWPTAERRSSLDAENSPWTWVGARHNGMSTAPTSWTDSKAATPTERGPVARAPHAREGSHAPVESAPLPAKDAPRYIADLGDVVLAEDRRGLLLVDRRLAMVRVIASRARSELTSGRLTAQALLFPLRIDATENALVALESAQPSLERLGFELRAGGPRSLALHAVPRVFAAASADELARCVVAMLPTLGADVACDALIERCGALAARDEAASPSARQTLLDEWYGALGRPGDARDASETRHFVPESVFRSKGCAS